MASSSNAPASGTIAQATYSHDMDVKALNITFLSIGKKAEHTQMQEMKIHS